MQIILLTPVEDDDSDDGKTYFSEDSPSVVEGFKEGGFTAAAVFVSAEEEEAEWNLDLFSLIIFFNMSVVLPFVALPISLGVIFVTGSSVVVVITLCLFDGVEPLLKTTFMTIDIFFIFAFMCCISAKACWILNALASLRI